jgi:hypothetical protein
LEDQSVLHDRFKLEGEQRVKAETQLTETLANLEEQKKLLQESKAQLVGAKLNVFPKKVYLHAGTRRGARALGLDAGPTLNVSQLPREFRALLPHEIEDVLCIFKDRFKASAAISAAKDLSNRSWCG